MDFYKEISEHFRGLWQLDGQSCAFNRLGHYASSPGNRAYSYAELVISSLVMVVNIASTHFAYPQSDGQAELARVAWSNMKMVYPKMILSYSFLGSVVHL